MREGQNIRAARHLRQSAHAPERKAWETLRSLRRQGFAVRRQHPVGPYVVDFAIVSLQLAIEIDGGVHVLSEVAERDAIRQRTIEALGWRVVRIPTDIALSADHLCALMQRELGL